MANLLCPNQILGVKGVTLLTVVSVVYDGDHNQIIMTFSGTVTYNAASDDQRIQFGDGNPSNIISIAQGTATQLIFSSMTGAGNAWIILSQPAYVTELLTTPQSGTIS